MKTLAFLLVALNCCLGQTPPVTLTPECDKVDAANADYPPGTSGLVGCYPASQRPPDQKSPRALNSYSLHCLNIQRDYIEPNYDNPACWPESKRPKPHRSSRVLRDFQRLHPCPANGRKIGACPGFVKDHVIPLCAGGPDVVSNLQWQRVDAARAKDKLERKQCACSAQSGIWLGGKCHYGVIR